MVVYGRVHNDVCCATRRSLIANPEASPRGLAASGTSPPASAGGSSIHGKLAACPTRRDTSPSTARKSLKHSPSPPVYYHGRAWQTTSRGAPRLTEISDDELVSLFRDGDAEAFDMLFDRHRVSVYHFARTMLGDPASADDVLQETFLAVARAASRYVPRGRFRVWLMRIVRNRCLNRIESDRARRSALAEVDIGIVEPPSRDPTPPERVEMDEEMRLLQAAIGRLPDRQREALVLYAFERLAYREIAVVLDMPINTVKTLIHRARAALAQALERAR